MESSKIIKLILLKALALIFCIVPVSVCIISYFPLWSHQGGGYVVSGFAVLLFVVAFSPLFRLVKDLFKSPAGYTVWFCLFVLFFVLSKIANEMTVISLVGFFGNLIGALLFKLAERYENENREVEKE
jgi:chromate transport protein ChrA